MKKNTIILQKCTRVALALVLAVTAGMSCSYKFSGGGALPGGATSVFISIFENRSSETGIENMITNDLVYEMTRNGQQVVSNSDEGDSVIHGVVKSVSEETATSNVNRASLESRVIVVVDIVMESREGDKIKSLDDVLVKQVYTTDADNQVNLNNRKEALIILSKRLSENVYSRLTEDF